MMIVAIRIVGFCIRTFGKVFGMVIGIILISTIVSVLMGILGGLLPFIIICAAIYFLTRRTGTKTERQRY